MAFDGFTLKSVITELQNCLIGGKLTKIYEPTSDEVVLSIYSHGVNYALTANISSSFYSLHLTTTSKPNPLSAPNFCMLLRKYLIGFKIKNISTLGLERIAIIEFEGYNELNDLVKLKLIVELMGKHSNIILVNQNNVIIDSLKHLHTFSGSYRNILPNAVYEFPTSSKIEVSSITDISTFYNNISETQKVNSISSYFLEHFIGTSKNLIEYSMSSIGISENFTLENFKSLLLYLKKLYTDIENQNSSCFLFKDDYVIKSSLETNSSLEVNFFLDDYYTKKEQAEEFTRV